MRATQQLFVVKTKRIILNLSLLGSKRGTFSGGVSTGEVALEDYVAGWWLRRSNGPVSKTNTST